MKKVAKPQITTSQLIKKICKKKKKGNKKYINNLHQCYKEKENIGK